LHQIYYKKLTDFSRNINEHPRQDKNRNNLGLLGNGMSQMRREENRLYQYEEEVVERKTSICHMLGKFLYGKRFNIYYNPNIKIKKDN
jgi:nitrate/nitrite-specific signal transduction histidine kinase